MTYVDDKIRCILMAQPNDIRRAGWAVAIHNDYRLNGQACTFWAFTKKLPSGVTVAVKGEGESDAVALNAVRHEIAHHGWNMLRDGFLVADDEISSV